MADVKTVVRRKSQWLKIGNSARYYKCARCGMITDFNEYGNGYMWHCPNCLAYMSPLIDCDCVTYLKGD